MKNFFVWSGLIFWCRDKFFREKWGSPKFTTEASKTLSFDQGLFLGAGTRFYAKNEAHQNSLLRPEKTLAYFLNSIFYSALLLGVFGLRRDLNSKTKVQSPNQNFWLGPYNFVKMLNHITFISCMVVTPKYYSISIHFWCGIVCCKHCCD